MGALVTNASDSGEVVSCGLARGLVLTDTSQTADQPAQKMTIMTVPAPTAIRYAPTDASSKSLSQPVPSWERGPERARKAPSM